MKLIVVRHDGSAASAAFVEPIYDACSLAKIERALAQSRDRAATMSIVEALRSLSFEGRVI